jgi:pilus assembly protein CpaB
MSSALRLSIILVLLLAATALGLIAYNMNQPKQVSAVVGPQVPVTATVGYFVAARALPRGTLARDEDFAVRSVPRDRVPAEAILETPEAKLGLPGSLLRKFVDAGSPVTLEDILRPKDRGFLASVLAPDSRAISIKVDEESGVSGLIRPGDHVDVVLTQVFEKADSAHRALSETVLRNVRIIAIDQEITEGGRPVGAALVKMAQTVSLELTPDQVKKVTVAKQLGRLSLAVRAAVDQWDKADAGVWSRCDGSPELAGQSVAVTVQSGGEVKKYSFRKQDSEERETRVSCDGSQEVARQTVNAVGGKPTERP